MGVDRAVLFRLATSGRFERVIKALPSGEDMAWRAARRYVAGSRQTEALTAAARLLAVGHGVSIDLFGDQYRSLAAALPPSPADV